MSNPIRDWIGGNGDFSDASQWEEAGGSPPAAPPGAGDTAVFNMGGSVDITDSVTNLVAQVSSGVTLDVADASYKVTGIPGDIFGLAFNNAGDGGNLTVTGDGLMSTYGIMGSAFGLSVTNSAIFADTDASTFAGGTTLVVSDGASFVGSDLTFGGIPSTDDAMIVDNASVTLDNLSADATGAGSIAIVLTDGELDLGSSDDAGSLSLSGPTSLVGTGTIENSDGGVLTIETDASAEIVASGGVLELDGLVTTGDMTIDAASTLILPGTADGGANVTFAGTTGQLDLPLPEDFAGKVFDFGDDNTIELVGSVASFDYNGTSAGGELTLDLVGSTTVEIDFRGSYSLASFHIASDADEPEITDITFVPCFVAGTLILTASGEVAVEHLAEGDVMVMASGHRRPITWLGTRHVDCSRHPRKQDVLPVRIAPNAFAPGQPRRPLWLSPDHAVFIDRVLIPIRHLVNGTTIAQQDVEEVIYWHVELPRHDVLLAEGLPVESYLDTGNGAALSKVGALPQTPPKAGPLETPAFS